MFIVNGYFDHETMTILGIIGIILFVIQLVFCFIPKGTAIKLIPVYIILLFVLLATALYIGVFGPGSFGASRILAWLLTIGIVAAIVGDVIAWIVFGIVINCKKNAKQILSNYIYWIASHAK